MLEQVKSVCVVTIARKRGISTLKFRSYEFAVPYYCGVESVEEFDSKISDLTATRDKICGLIAILKSDKIVAV